MAKYIYTCIDCDYTREHNRPQRGVRCKPCAHKHKSEQSRDASKTTCPKCGNKKSYKAKHCKHCVDQSGVNNGMFGKTNPVGARVTGDRCGNKHWNWKGGNVKERNGKIITWAKLVKEHGECDICSYNNPMALDAHHLISYAHGNPNNYDVGNGVCLCKNCHSIFHKTYGFGSNTREQYIEFKEGMING